MSSSDLAPRDLKVIGNDCLTISHYRNDASKDPDLQHLISAFGTLGRQLHALAHRLENLEFEDKSYHNLQLQDQVHDASIAFQKYFAIANNGGRAQSKQKRIFNPRSIQKLQQLIDDHISKANERETKILLINFHKELKVLSRDHDTDGRTNPDVSDQEIGTATQTPHRDDDTSSILSDATGAVRLARMIFWDRSKQLTAKGNRGRPDTASPSRSTNISQPLADGLPDRDQIVRDLVEMIKNTPIQAIEKVSSEIYDKLTSIVFKAKQLETTLELPETDPPESSPSETGKTRVQTVIASSSTEIVNPGNRQEKSFPWTGQRTVQKDRREAVLPQIAPVSGSFAVNLFETFTQSSDEVTRLREQTNNCKNSRPPGIPEDSKLRTPATNLSTSSPSLEASNDGRSETFSVLKPSSPEREMEGALESYYLDFGGRDHWVKIRCPQLGLKPTFCTLGYFRSENSLWIDISTSPRHTAPSLDGPVRSEKSIEEGTSSEATQRGSAHSPPAQPTFRHRYDLDTRPIPAVLIPRYEGLRMTPAEPYSILFTEKQDFGKARADHSPKPSADLQYIFSHEEDRDQFRSRLFGKKLLASVEFKSIAVDTTVCERHVISLWYDEGGKCQTVTFPTSTYGTDRRPVAEVEYEVWGLEKSKHFAKLDKPLILLVKPLRQHGSPEPQPKRVNTLLSTFSGRSKTNAPVPDGQRCVLYFRQIADKEKLLSDLRPLQPI